MTKIVFVGDTLVGKTSLINKMVYGSFFENPPTIMANFCSINVEVNNESLPLHLWDTAGAERYQSLSLQFARNSKIIVFCYANDSKSSFESLNKWYQAILEYLDNDFVPLVVCCKSDLPPAVPQSDAEELANSWNTQFIETSSLTEANIEKLKDELGKIAYQLDAPKVPDQPNPSPNPGKCC